MTAEDIVEKKEPKRLPVWACIPLFIGIFFIFMGLYGTLARGFLSMVLGVEARHPGYFAGKQYAAGCSHCRRYHVAF